MNSIHSVLSQGAKGKAMGLGPVEVTAAYPADTTPRGKQKRNLMIKDGSGNTRLTLWGAAAGLPIDKGQTITLKGQVACNEYNGNITLQAEHVTLADGGEGGAPASAPATASHSHAGAPSNKDQQIMRQNALAHATALVVASGVSDVFSAQDLVLDLAQRFAEYSETGSIRKEPEADEPY